MPTDGTAMPPVPAVILSGTPTAGQPATPEERLLRLRPMLDPAKFTAIGIVHGNNAVSAKAWGLLQRRLTVNQGAVWVQAPDLLAQLTGEDADRLQAAFAGIPGMLMTFFAVKAQRADAAWALPAARVHSGNVDLSLNRAAGAS